MMALIGIRIPQLIVFNILWTFFIVLEELLFVIILPKKKSKLLMHGFNIGTWWSVFKHRTYLLEMIASITYYWRSINCKTSIHSWKRNDCLQTNHPYWSWIDSRSNPFVIGHTNMPEGNINSVGYLMVVLVKKVTQNRQIFTRRELFVVWKFIGWAWWWLLCYAEQCTKSKIWTSCKF